MPLSFKGNGWRQDTIHKGSSVLEIAFSLYSPDLLTQYQTHLCWQAFVVDKGNDGQRGLRRGFVCQREALVNNDLQIAGQVLINGIVKHNWEFHSGEAKSLGCRRKGYRETFPGLYILHKFCLSACGGIKKGFFCCCCFDVFASINKSLKCRFQTLLH